jgi:hypothetical protein
MELEQFEQLSVSFAVHEVSFGALVLEKAAEEIQVSPGFAGFVYNGGAGQQGKPTPEGRFGIELAYVAGHAQEEQLEGFAGGLFISSQHKQVTEQPIEIEREKLLVGGLIAFNHACRERGNVGRFLGALLQSGLLNNQATRGQGGTGCLPVQASPT